MLCRPLRDVGQGFSFRLKFDWEGGDVCIEGYSRDESMVPVTYLGQRIYELHIKYEVWSCDMRCVGIKECHCRRAAELGSGLDAALR